MRGVGGAEHTATARTWTRRAEPRGAARRRARLLGVCRTIFSSPLMSFLPAGAEVIDVSEGSADELPEVRVRWTGTSEILGGVEYTVLVSPTSSEGSGEWMSVPLAPVGAFSCPVCRTPLRGLTRALYLAHSLGELLPISSFVMKPSLSRLICQNCHTMALSEGAVGSRQRSS